MKYIIRLNKSINIVSFDVPYPPNYGGVIDVFYKIKALHNLGIKIFLHTFEYGRGEQIELNKYCEKVFYYKRQINLIKIFSKIPFIVNTRNEKKLLNNLLNNNYPILFEGLHTTFPLLTNKFKNRKTIIRNHNVEHNYYTGLARSETNLFKKLFFRIESKKLKYFEFIFKKTNYILTISPFEQDYFSNSFPLNSIYIPAFHQNEKVETNEGLGNFALFNGDLRVSDNISACEFLIDVFSKISYPLIISSSFENNRIQKKIIPYKNISFKLISTNDELKFLLQNAHINVLPSFQNTGIKLKLINALFNGRFCLVNETMAQGTGLKENCIIANSVIEFRLKIEELSLLNFSISTIEKRKKSLAIFNTQNNAQKIINLLQ